MRRVSIMATIEPRSSIPKADASRGSAVSSVLELAFDKCEFLPSADGHVMRRMPWVSHHAGASAPTARWPLRWPSRWPRRWPFAIETTSQIQGYLRAGGRVRGWSQGRAQLGSDPGARQVGAPNARPPGSLPSCALVSRLDIGDAGRRSLENTKGAQRDETGHARR